MSEQVEEYMRQGRLQPGDAGWWQVWGASVRDIVAGDIVYDGDNKEWFYVEEVFEAKNQARKGIVVDGERQTIGLLCPVGVVRKGHRNTLSAFAR